MSREPLVLVGGAGGLGAGLVRALVSGGATVTVVDRREPAPALRPLVADFLRADLLRQPVELPPGQVVLATGGRNHERRHPWTVVLSTAMLTARLLPQLSNRAVTLLSSLAVYGVATGALSESTALDLSWSASASDSALREWCADARARAGSGEPDLGLARRLLDAAGRDGVYGQAKRAQELLLGEAVPRLTILRLAEVFGPGRPGLVADLTARALSGRGLAVADVRRSLLSVADLGHVLRQDVPPGVYDVGQPAICLMELAELVADATGCRTPVRVRPADGAERDQEVDTGRLTELLGALPPLRPQVSAHVRAVLADGGPHAHPPIEVVLPPRPEQPEVVSSRQQAALWSGLVKHGNQWTDRLTEALTATLALPPDRALLLTTSGTEALRLALLATVGPARPGEVAVLPSFTFNATAEVVRQLGYRLVFCDVDPATWTLDPGALARLLDRQPARVVVAVDTLGNPCDYRALLAVRDRFGTVLVADSAPALGAQYQHRPVGSQADAHAFSMSFAKVVSAGGAGGAVVVAADAVERLTGPQNWLRSALLPELAAIVALDGVQHLPALVARRHQVAAVYADLAARHPNLTEQRVAPGNRHAWVHWTVRVADGRRDALARHLAGRGIGTKPYYAPLLHRLDWQGHAEPGELPVTESLGDEVLALPMSSELTVAQAELVASCVDWFLGDR
ncbi:MAG: DegT/DnrJ/EryC1/StrS family aminotransferase [Actinobacteria bacterium]|nr:DegT/DnrJ/EryC1/StrS family aminotransferase [Actinomycetota bacterium]